jgi:hypothetical protein
MEAPFRLRKGPGPACLSTVGSSAANRPASTLAAEVLGLSSTIAPGAGEAMTSTMLCGPPPTRWPSSSETSASAKFRDSARA